MIDALDTVTHEIGDFLGRNRSATATEHANVAGAQFVQPVDHVAEELVVAALVGTDGDAVRILLDRGTDDVVDAAIMAKVDHFGALRLDQAAHDVDRGIMAVEQGCGRHKTQRRRTTLARHAGQIVGGSAHSWPPRRRGLAILARIMKSYEYQ